MAGGCRHTGLISCGNEHHAFGTGMFVRCVGDSSVVLSVVVDCLFSLLFSLSLNLSIYCAVGSIWVVFSFLTVLQECSLNMLA